MRSSDERLVSWFSCGAASAVATLYAAERGHSDFHAVYCRVREEHPDNERFLSDFEKVTGITIEVVENEKYNGSIYEVFQKKRFLKNQYGAPCTLELKKNMRNQYQRPGDIQVFGYTREEQNRADRFIDANQEVNEWFPLIEKNISKNDCLRIIDFLGIKPSVMYELGYNNNNCVGCVKGGMGYWNKIRVDFPDRFNQMAIFERLLGHALCKDKNGYVFLDELDPTRGNKVKDMPGDCGFTCEFKP
jgi:3'-phosphoadenosine 5'-phosphosulfate sulfotransferase (PAPS reductase)/FAD synthetase